MDELDIHRLPIEGAFTFCLPAFEDERGSFQRLYSNSLLAKFCNEKRIQQVNVSRTMRMGTIRGLHFQYPPNTETKIIRCLTGSVWDVIVDIRQDSPTFLHWESVVLSQENKKMILVPEGVAHGFQSLENETVMLYLHTEAYTKASEGGLKFDDPVLKITWPLAKTMISERDQSHKPIDLDKFKGLIL